MRFEIRTTNLAETNDVFAARRAIEGEDAVQQPALDLLIACTDNEALVSPLVARVRAEGRRFYPSRGEVLVVRRVDAEVRHVTTEWALWTDAAVTERASLVSDARCLHPSVEMVMVACWGSDSGSAGAEAPACGWAVLANAARIDARIVVTSAMVDEVYQGPTLETLTVTNADNTRTELWAYSMGYEGGYTYEVFADLDAALARLASEKKLAPKGGANPTHGGFIAYAVSPESKRPAGLRALYNFFTPNEVRILYTDAHRAHDTCTTVAEALAPLGLTGWDVHPSKRLGVDARTVLWMEGERLGATVKTRAVDTDPDDPMALYVDGARVEVTEANATRPAVQEALDNAAKEAYGLANTAWADLGTAIDEANETGEGASYEAAESALRDYMAALTWLQGYAEHRFNAGCEAWEAPACETWTGTSMEDLVGTDPDGEDRLAMPGNDLQRFAAPIAALSASR